jgi:cytochrome P450
MLSLDGAEHSRHREPFVPLSHPARVRARYTGFIETHADRLISKIRPTGNAELRRQFAGPLAAMVVTEALGLRDVEVDAVLSWYSTIVGAVSEAMPEKPVSATGVETFDRLRTAVVRAIDKPGNASLLTEVAASAPGGLNRDEVVSNAAVVMFGGIDTTEGMILNAVRHLLEDPEAHALVLGNADLLPGAIEESIRLEPAAALLDRYATRDVELGNAQIRRGDRVSVSIAGANRDPAVFTDPGRFDIDRSNTRQHLAFGQGPHFCLGAQLARTETHVAVQRLLDRLPELRLDPERSNTPQGLIFRKPPDLYVHWTTACSEPSP